MGNKSTSLIGDLPFQLHLMHLIFTNESFYLSISRYFENSYLENKFLGYFYDKCHGHYQKYNKLPQISYYSNELRKIEDKDRPEYYKWLVRIVQSKPDNPDYIIDHSETYVKKNQFVEMYKELPRLYQDNFDKALSHATSKTEEISTLSFNDDEVLTLDSLERDEDEGVVVATGIPQFDEALEGGYRSGDLVVWLGDSGVGKSIILVNTGVQILEQGKKVLHINLEGRSQIPIDRYLARAARVGYNTVKTGIYKDAQEKIRVQESINKYRGLLRIIHMASFSVTIEDIFAKVKQVQKDFPFDVVIIDYGDLLSTKTQTDLRHSQTMVFRGLSKIALNYNVPVVTATQATRPDNMSEDQNFFLTQRHISESYEKARVASVIFSINRTRIDEMENKLRLMLCKNRDGMKGIRVGCYNDYTKMIPFDESMGFYDTRTSIISDKQI